MKGVSQAVTGPSKAASNTPAGVLHLPAMADTGPIGIIIAEAGKTIIDPAPIIACHKETGNVLRYVPGFLFIGDRSYKKAATRATFP